MRSLSTGVLLLGILVLWNLPGENNAATTDGPPVTTATSNNDSTTAGSAQAGQNQNQVQNTAQAGTTAASGAGGASGGSATQGSGSNNAGATQGSGSNNEATTQGNAATQGSGSNNGAATQGSGSNNEATTQGNAATQGSGSNNGAATQGSGSNNGAATQGSGSNNDATTQGSGSNNGGGKDEVTTKAGGSNNVKNTATTTKANVKDQTTTSRPSSGENTYEEEKKLAVDKITTENFQQFADMINKDLPPEQLTKIEPSAMLNVNVLKTLSSADFSLGQKQMLADKLTDGILDKLNKNENVDASVIAAGGGSVRAEAIEKFDKTKLKEILTAGKEQGRLCGRDKDCAKNYAKAMAKTGVFTDNPNLLADASDIIGFLPAKNLKQIISGQQLDVTATFGQAELPPEHARLIVKELVKPDLTTADPGAELRKIPPNIRGAVSVDALASISADNAAGAFEALMEADTLETGDEVISPSLLLPDKPTLAYLAEKIKSKDTIDVALLKKLIQDDLLSAADYEKHKNQICSAITKEDIRGGTPPLYSPAACSVYDNCKSIWGAPSLTNIPTKYGALVVCASTDDLKNIFKVTDSGNFISALSEISSGGDFTASMGKLEALAEKLETRLGTAGNTDLTNGMTLRKIAFLLPYVKTFTTKFDALTTDQQANVCKELAHINLARLAMDKANAITSRCAKFGTLRRMFGGGRSGGPSVTHASFLLTSDFGTSNDSAITCERLMSAIDLVPPFILDCDTKRKILQCAKDSVSSKLNNGTTLNLFGSLCEFYSAAEWETIDDVNKCGLDETIPKQLLLNMNMNNYRQLVGGFRSEKCDMDGYKRCISEVRKGCSGTTATRRKRATSSALTCTEIQKLGQTVDGLSSTDLSSLSNDEFEACAAQLGNTAGFSSAQWEALATKAKEVWGATTEWTSENLMTAGGIVSGLTAADIDNLALTSMDAIISISSKGMWSKDKLDKAFARVKADKYGGDLSKIGAADLKLMGDFVCGATSEDISNLAANAYCGAAEAIGLLETCEVSQLVKLAEHAKTCYGANVSTWTPSEVQSMGAVIGGLGKDDIKELDINAMSQIKPYTISKIPTENINGFTAEQIAAMDSTQANSFTSDQLSSLDQSKLDTIKSKSTVAEDGDGDGNGDGNGGGQGGCGVPEASVILVATVVLSSLMRI